MKKLWIMLALVLALMLTCLTGCVISTNDNYGAKADAAAVFTLDVNPGVRIYVKEDNTVIAVEATNEDGKEVVAELELEGESYEEVVEKVIDSMEEKGYLEGENNSVLLSVEKKAIDISEKVNEKINKAFEKHGKVASVIEQELDALDTEVGRQIDEIAKKYKISEGKAHLIEKIREEFPELSEEELAQLRVNELGMMLEDTSEDVKGHFKKVGKAVEDAYVGREQALATAIESLEINPDDVTMERVRVVRAEGEMLYEVKLVYDGMEYEITINATSGEVLSTESKEYEEFDAEGAIDEFCNKQGIDAEGIRDEIINNIFGKHKQENEKALTKGEILKSIMEKLEISEEALKKTEVEIYKAESGTVYSVTIENDAGDIYTLVVEAYSGAIIKVELNGEAIEITADLAE